MPDGQGEAIGVSQGAEATFEAALNDAARQLIRFPDEMVKVIIVEVGFQFGGFASPMTNEIRVKVRRQGDGG